MKWRILFFTGLLCFGAAGMAAAQEIALLEPKNGACYTTGTDITVRQDVAGGAGITDSELYLNGAPIEVKGGAYTKNLGPLAPGAYQLEARGSDNQGISRSDTVWFTVEQERKDRVLIGGGDAGALDGSFESYQNTDGDIGPAGWDANAAYSKGGRITAYTADQEHGACVKIENVGSAGSIYPYLQSPTYTDQLKGRVVIEATIRCETGASTTRSLSIRDGAGTVDLLSMNSGTVKLQFAKEDGVQDTQTNGVASYELGRWYTVKFIINTQTGRFDFYLDGKRLAENRRLTRTVSGIRNFKFFQGGSQRAVTYLDDISFYVLTPEPRLTAAVLENGRGDREPFSGYVRVCPDKIRLSFDREVDPDSFARHGSLLDWEGNTVFFTTRREGLDMILIPEEGLGKEKYTVEIGQGLTALDGSVLNNTVYQSFQWAGYRLKVTELRFMDLKSNQLLYLEDAGAGRVYAQGGIRNMADTPQTVMLLTGVYQDGRLEQADVKQSIAEPDQTLVLRSGVFQAADLEGRAVKAYLWDEDMAPLVPAEFLPDGPRGTLIFQSGFEPDTAGSSASELKTLSGRDQTFEDRSDWTRDLNGHPNIGSLSFEYESGTTAERYAKLSPAPDDASNTVLEFYQGSVTTASKGRVQGSIYGNKELPAVRYRFRMYLGEDFDLLKKDSAELSWFTMAEFWNQPGWGAVNYPYRVSFGLYKPPGAGQNLYFKVGSDTCWPYLFVPQWYVKNLTYPVKTKTWLDCEIYYRQGTDNTGRFCFAVKPEGGKRQVVLDVRDRTYDPENPIPHGLTHFNPWKLYTAKGTVNQVRDAGGVLRVYWDDVSFWAE